MEVMAGLLHRDEVGSAKVKLADVAGLKEAKEALYQAILQPIRFKDHFVGAREPWKGILLYGVREFCFVFAAIMTFKLQLPGTGKSFLASAVANELDADFFNVPSSSIFSRWLGSAERSVKALFKTARERSKTTGRPVVIFMDEVDSLLSTRNDTKSGSGDRVLNEFLQQMDGVGTGGKDNVLVLGATNHPWKLDDAIKRRLDKKIFIPLPDEEARKVMFERKLKGMSHVITPKDFEELALKSEGYSGSDIRQVIRGAAFRPIMKFNGATHFKVNENEMIILPRALLMLYIYLL